MNIQDGLNNPSLRGSIATKQSLNTLSGTEGLLQCTAITVL